MKKIVFVAILMSSVLGVGRVEAQISLLRTFNEYVQPVPSGDFNGYYPVSLTTSPTNPIKIYNEDFSVRASVSISVPSGYQMTSVGCISEKIFNSDGNVEFIVVFTNTATSAATGNTRTTMRLYSENGSVLKDFGSAQSLTSFLHVTSDGTYRLEVIRTDYNNGNPITYTDIYSLPGKQETTSALPPLIKEETELSYKLKMGETATMKIYNIKGQLIETKKIDYTFNKLLLNTAKYPRGTYIYKINDIEVQKFVLK